MVFLVCKMSSVFVVASLTHSTISGLSHMSSSSGAPVKDGRRAKRKKMKAFWPFENVWRSQRDSCLSHISQEVCLVCTQEWHSDFLAFPRRYVRWVPKSLLQWFTVILAFPIDAENWNKLKNTLLSSLSTGSVNIHDIACARKQCGCHCHPRAFNMSRCSR